MGPSLGHVDGHRFPRSGSALDSDDRVHTAAEPARTRPPQGKVVTGSGRIAIQNAYSFS
jgi:hypothetical protein